MMVRLVKKFTLPFAIARVELLGVCKRSSILVISLGSEKIKPSYVRIRLKFLSIQTSSFS